MKFIFVFTNQSSPRVDVITEVSSITYSVVSDVKTLSVSGKKDGVSGTYIFTEPNGIPSILWE